MKTQLHKSESRGHANHGWLISKHTFSFANYYNQDRIQFGNLRVLNDDIIAPSSGFGRHPHDNMEIVSIPISGQLLHKDSMGHQQIIGENEVQVMSAGKGIFHSEYNASSTNKANFLQLWFLPDKKNIDPVYNQHLFDPDGAKQQWQTLVDNETGPLKLNQKAKIARIFLDKSSNTNYQLKSASNKAYFFVIKGEVNIEGIELKDRDGLGIEEQQIISIIALTSCSLLSIEI